MAIARTATARKTQALIAARMILVEQSADYFTLLGVPFDAPTDVVQTAYLNLVRQLHPDKLNELGVPDNGGQGGRLFHHIGIAFGVLTDPMRRAEYLTRIGRPPSVEMTSRTRTADDIPATPAGDAYRRGESALRRDIPADAVVEFGRACALEPNNVDFHAMLGWAQFCAAADKATIAPETRKALDRAIQRSSKPTHARFLLGRVERMLGRDREALRHFQEVIEEAPNHPDARAEVRAIELRLAKTSKR
jgi:curved DNA-binding protein CbpA